MGFAACYQQCALLYCAHSASLLLHHVDSMQEYSGVGAGSKMKCCSLPLSAGCAASGHVFVSRSVRQQRPTGLPVIRLGQACHFESSIKFGFTFSTPPE
ncbi:hypothetical protein BDW02DRAFT_244120 [Decorospora gaudefroyi]|uniref:Uncharacterized protein n=1 Tax=Decorospora gaudefroyi TaxID=184978 RepID=A0A6A5KRF9_9PLEO|nr:hypothetical protein BDW02DRAFT_244120 [Decorospora gaudefroyi]